MKPQFMWLPKYFICGSHQSLFQYYDEWIHPLSQSKIKIVKIGLLEIAKIRARNRPFSSISIFSRELPRFQ